MKYTAKPVTQYARNKKVAMSPAKDTKTDEKRSDVKITDKQIVGDDNRMYNQHLEVTSSSADANSLKNASAPANDLGKAKGGKQAKTAAEKAKYNDWVVDQVSSGKQSAQHMADQGYIGKDRVAEYSKHTPKAGPKKGESSSTDNTSSRKETLTPVMTDAVDATHGTQTHRYEQTRQRNSYARKNFWAKNSSKRTLNKMEKGGYINAEGGFTEKGMTLSEDQRKGLTGMRDTANGINPEQMSFKNMTGKWASGGNTKVGNKFVRTEGIASEHKKAPEGKVEAKVKGAATTTQEGGKSFNFTNDPGVRSPTVANDPNANKKVKIENTLGEMEAVDRNPEKITLIPGKLSEGVFDETGPGMAGDGVDVGTPIAPKQTGPKTKTPLTGYRQSEGPGMTGDGNTKNSPFTMNRLHSSKSPAKMWNADVSPAKEGETVREHSPAGEAKMKKADKAAKDARWAAASPAKQQKPTKDYLANTAPGTVDNRPASLRQKYAEQEKREATPSWQAKFNPKEGGKISATKAKSPAKMWGPSKVKAGKNGFNR